MRAAEAGVISASKRINPQLSLNMEGYPLFESDRGAFFDSQELTLRFDQTLELGNKRGLRTEVARLKTSVAEAQLEAGRQQLISEVREAYFSTVRARQELSIARVLLSDMESIVRLNEQRLRLGQISGSEYRRSQLEHLSFLEKSRDQKPRSSKFSGHSRLSTGLRRSTGRTGTSRPTGYRVAEPGGPGDTAKTFRGRAG